MSLHTPGTEETIIGWVNYFPNSKVNLGPLHHGMAVAEHYASDFEKCFGEKPITCMLIPVVEKETRWRGELDFLRQRIDELFEACQAAEIVLRNNVPSDSRNALSVLQSVIAKGKAQ